MKNWEKYDKEVKEIGLDKFAMDKRTDMVCMCGTISCEDCRFHSPALEACGISAAKWLYSDYEELKPKLTKEEKAIVDAFIYTDYKIGRDKDGRLWLYAEICQLLLKKELFPFIESGTREWTLQELKELEVEE